MRQTTGDKPFALKLTALYQTYMFPKHTVDAKDKIISQIWNLHCAQGAENTKKFVVNVFGNLFGKNDVLKLTEEMIRVLIDHYQKCANEETKKIIAKVLDDLKGLEEAQRK